MSEIAELCDVTSFAVLRWVKLGQVEAIKGNVEGTKRNVYSVSGEALAEFFASRKQHQKEVAARRSEREAKAAAAPRVKVDVAQVDADEYAV